MMYPNLVKSKYPVLRGKDWIRTISQEDRQALIWIGMAAWQYGRMGGLARAKNVRDWNGRFMPAFVYEMDYGDYYD